MQAQEKRLHLWGVDTLNLIADPQALPGRKERSKEEFTWDEGAEGNAWAGQQDGLEYLGEWDYKACLGREDSEL